MVDDDRIDNLLHTFLETDFYNFHLEKRIAKTLPFPISVEMVAGTIIDYKKRRLNFTHEELELFPEIVDFIKPSTNINEKK